MKLNQFSYQSEKLSVARRCLMLPHTLGEAQSIGDAFHACSLGFKDLDESNLDDTARGWVQKLKGYMDTTGIKDPEGKGTWAIKAGGFDADDKLEISRTVDELAGWFDAADR